MLFRLFTNVRKLSLTQTARNMSSCAYFRWKDSAATFEFTFHVEKKDIGVCRKFNFSRQITETIGDFKNRICTNVEKTLSKKKKKKKSNTGEEEKQIDIEFYIQGQLLGSDVNCKDALRQGEVVMKLFGEEYLVHVNCPWISVLTLPDSILAGFPTYPNKFEFEFAEKEHCKFYWYRNDGGADEAKKQKSVGNLEWVKVGEEYCYTPSTTDIGCYIKLECVPVFGDKLGPSFDVTSRCLVQAGPGPSPTDVRHLFTPNFLQGTSFRVVSYNILADLYADSDYSRTVLFPYCPAYAIAIDYRKQLILKELIGYKADMICLQEVDSKVFDLDILPVLGSLGYQGVFSKKGGQVTEGLACLFRAERFELLTVQSVNLAEEIPTNPIFAHLHAAVKDNEPLKSRLYDRGTILKVVILKHKETGEELVIGITHLYFHPDADHIRLLQAAACLIFLQDALKLQQLKTSSRVSLLFCGDFNSTPEFGVYELMTKKHIPTDYRDWSSNENEAVKGLCLSHDLHLDSACGTPKYTNFTVEFADCLDYIFYHTDNLQVEHVVPLPSEEELKQYVAIPSVVLPSDHVALVADLKWKQK